MKKSDAKIRLVQEQTSRLSYSIFDKGKWWSVEDVKDIEACFLLAHTPSAYYPDIIGQLAGMLDHMRSKISDNHDDEDIEELTRVYNEVFPYCEEREIEIR